MQEDVDIVYLDTTAYTFYIYLVCSFLLPYKAVAQVDRV